MLLRLVSAVQRKGSANRQFVQRIPADVKGRVAGLTTLVPVGQDVVPVSLSASMTAVRLSLRTADLREAKVRHAAIAAHFEALWATLRQNRPATLTHKQATALAGEVYREWAEDRGGGYISATHQPDGSWITERHSLLNGEEHLWEVTAAKARQAEAEGDIDALEAMLGPIVDRALLDRGIRAADSESRAMVLEAFIKALGDAFESRQRQAEGNYAPDPKATRFPPVTDAFEAAPKPALMTGGKISLTGLVEAWWPEAKAANRSVSTYESYRNTMRRFVAFVKHDDAGRIRLADVLAFKDARLAEGRSPKTVGDSDIAGLRAVFKWAVDNGKLVENPAEKAKVVRAKQMRIRSKGFTAEETSALLRQSLDYANLRESPKLAAAKRWVPWLCAYTGARVGEMVQLRKEDFRQAPEGWVLRITPEAGTVKDKEMREVLLHTHLLDLGFIDFVVGSQDGYLFLTPDAEGQIRGRWEAAKNRLREFAREAVTDKAVAPQHGWRHLFKTIGREAGIEDSILDSICGHAPSSIGGRYGGVTLKAQRDAFARFPRFEVGTREPDETQR